MNEAEKFLAARNKAGQENSGSLDTASRNNVNTSNNAWRDASRFQRVNKRGGCKLWSLALFSGLFAIVSSFIRQLTTGLPDILAAIVVAPPVEEILKIAIPIMVLEHREKWIGSGRDLLWLALGSALIFAIVENLLYSFVYLKNPSTELLFWRWSACTTMHVLASGLSGVGLMRAFNRSLRTDQPPRFVWEWPWLAGAIAVHMAYNTFAVFVAEPF